MLRSGRSRIAALSDAGVRLAAGKGGRLTALAVSTGKRAAIAPDIPTVAESGFPGYDVSGWFGILAPAGTPAVIEPP